MKVNHPHWIQVLIDRSEANLLWRIVLRDMIQELLIQGDINSHDSDMIAYESINTSVPSIDISDHSNIDPQSDGMTDDTSVNPIVDVEVEPVRRSARQRKQTQFFGNPWLYRISCSLTPRVLSDLLQHVPDTQDSLTDMN